ncbi:mannose/fructose/N-acetylgalactosamine-specific phosphotransferase system component IID [Sphingomonas sp. UYAg733]
MHPLTLLIALVAVLVLMLAANRYFGLYGYAGGDGDVDRMAKRVLAYANWSFSLGIFAILLGSWIVFRGRLGYNLIEHAVLAVFCQNIILAIIIVNLVPTLIWRGPEFILWHKWASQYYIFAVKLLIVAAAYKQFFLLRLRSDWPRLLLACGIFAGLSWALLRLYALAILWIVTR